MTTLASYTSAAFTTATGVAVAANATVEVRRESDSGLASIFSDRAGTALITNPSAFADSSGRFVFYAAGVAGGYSVQVTKGAETYTARYQAIGTAAELDQEAFVLAGTAVLNSQFTKGGIPVGSAAGAQSNLTVGADGYGPVASSGATKGVVWAPPGLGYNLVGGYLDWSPAGSPGFDLLTVSIKTWSGADPSDTEPVFIAFRSSTPGTGTPTYRKITAATSITINATALLGTVNGVAFRLWCAAFDDGGTIRLALNNCLTTVAGAGAGRDVTEIYRLAGFGIASATLEDNTSDSAGVFYSSGATVSSKPYATLGYGEWGELAGSPSASGLPVAGIWSAGPTRIQLYGPDIPLPGQAIQMKRNDTGAVATGTTAIPQDDTIPQSNEGDQFMSQQITPSSAANALRVKASGVYANTAGGAAAQAIFVDAVANALASTIHQTVATNLPAKVDNEITILAGGTAAMTFKVRAGYSGGATTTFNGTAGTRLYGGVLHSFTQVEEIMG